MRRSTGPAEVMPSAKKGGMLNFSYYKPKYITIRGDNDLNCQKITE